MISSIVLFFRRDCAGGAGPTVDVPRLVPAVAAAPAPPVAEAEVVAAAAGVDDAGVEVVALNFRAPVDAVVAAVDGAVVVVAVVPIFANILPPAAVVVAGAVDSVEAPSLGVPKSPPDGAAVVVAGVAVDAGVPRENREFWVLLPAVVAVARDVDGLVVVAGVRENAG